MFYYLYEIKNLTNNKIYIGVHKTKNMDDGYMGSGADLCRAIKEEGSENFIKTIHETFESSKAMYLREEEVVNAEFLARDDVYNKRRGGFGGFDYINGNKDIIKTRSKKVGNTIKQLFSEGKWISNFKNLHSDPEFLRKKNEALALVNRSGENSSNFEKTWITNGIENRFVKKTDVISLGWAPGRKFQSINAGSKNPNYGSIWITNGIENRLLKNSEEVPDGWVKGILRPKGSDGRFKSSK